MVPGSSDIGRFLVVLGVFLLVLGLIFQLAGRFSPIGHLPGDIVIRKDNFVFYFPLVTCILLSLLLTLFFWVFRAR